MARNDIKGFKFHPVDRAQPRTGFDMVAHAAPAPAASWRALAAGTVASTLVVAVVVSAFALVDAVVSAQTVKLARKAPASTEMQTRRACVLPDDKFLTAPMQGGPALFVSD
jgi:hypothetical protein